MFSHNLVKISGTRNCHVHEMSETIWHERLKLLAWIQPLKNIRWKSTVWRCEHYLINWQNIFTVSIPHYPQNDLLNAFASPTPRNCFCWLSSTWYIRLLLPAFLPNVHRFKKNFTGWVSNNFVKNMAIENFTTPQMCSCITFWFIFNHDMSMIMSCNVV